ncbi:TA system VapC family ribonuclease toxin [Actinomycetaceae bacterium MB13-C1-2]|nr:TA system VapC family ribonuclease toxin [Actinomycetaceae bacterium MB13-C1-2]
MRPLLLDVNVLIGLIDPTHEHHDAAHTWFFAEPERHWLTCPTTENGVIRIVAHPRYSNTQPVWMAMESLQSLTDLADHERVAENTTLIGNNVDRRALLSSSQVTDTYLALLALEHGAQLATFDRHLSLSALPDDVSVLQIPN